MATSIISGIISGVIAVAFVTFGILYAIFAPKNKVKKKKATPSGTVFVKNKGISMDERKIYPIPYEDYNL